MVRGASHRGRTTPYHEDLGPSSSPGGFARCRRLGVGRSDRLPGDSDADVFQAAATV